MMTGFTKSSPTGQVLVIGEAILDFLPSGRGPLNQQNHWHVHSGGAPANVAIGLALHGIPVRIASAVGADAFGSQLKGMIESTGVDCTHVVERQGESTGLCFVTLDAAGERTFTHRGGHPFSEFGTSEALALLAHDIEVIHFGCGALRNAKTAEAVENIINGCNAMVTCDPGFFPSSWGDRDAVEKRLLHVMSRSQIFKCAIGDIKAMLDIADPAEGVEAILRHGALLAVVTDGHHGAWWGFDDERGHVPAPDVELVDSTGAGDAFMAGFLRSIPTTNRRQQVFTSDAVEKAVLAASLQGGRAVTRFGATTAERSHVQPTPPPMP